MTLPFGIDISKYQASGDMKQLPDWAKMRANTDFVALRAGISWGYEDPLFSTGWNALQAHCRMAYHVLYPSQDGVRQADWFWDIVSRAGIDTAHDRLVVDVELDQGCTKAQITTALLAYMARILYLSGRNPVIYSRASWINAHVDVSGLPALTEWWLAHYLTAQPSPAYTPEKPSPPALPKGVSSWLIHQTGERGNGSAVGVRSHYVDTNRWNGTLEDLRAYFGLGEVVPPEPEPPVEKLFDAKVVTTPPKRLKTRYTPAGAYRPEADWLQSQAIVPVYETHATGYYRVEDATWASETWLHRLDFTPPASMLDIAPLSQRDPRWASDKLGNSNLTIGSHGCLVTCLAMAVGVTPAEFNRRLREVGGFTGALVYWKMVEVAYPQLDYYKFIDCRYVPAPLNEIDAMLALGIPVEVEVDFNPDTAFVDQHWILIIGKAGDDYIANDPWTGERISFRAKYGDPARWIFRIVGYRRNQL